MRTKRLLIIALLAMMAGKMAAQYEVLAPQNVYARPNISLNGDWNYFADPQEQGYYDYRMNPTQWGYFLNAKPQRPSDLVEYDFDACPTMRVPGDWNTQDNQLFLYEGTVWYKRDFEVKNEGKRFLLYFGAVNYEAIVYVNGKKAGRHEGGFTPFCFDVSDLVKEGKNFVIVKVDNKRHRDNVPTQIFDWWNYGGITRDVLLLTVGNTYIDDYSLCLKKQEARGKKQEIDFSLKLNRPEAGQEVTLNIPELKLKQKFVTDAEGKINAQLTTLNSNLV